MASEKRVVKRGAVPNHMIMNMRLTKIIQNYCSDYTVMETA